MGSADVRVALTFDAEHPGRPGSPPEAPDRALDALAEAGIRATFFLQGRWARAHPDRARRIAREGHLVGSHSHFHAPLTLLRDEGIERDVVQSGEAISRAAGADPRPWFRAPWGDGAGDRRVLGALERLGYRHVGWDVVGEDWEEGRTAEDVREAVRAGTAAAGDPAVVLLHTWPAATAEALSDLILALGGEGATFVTVDRLPPQHVAGTANPAGVAENPR